MFRGRRRRLKRDGGKEEEGEGRREIRSEDYSIDAPILYFEREFQNSFSGLSWKQSFLKQIDARVDFKGRCRTIYDDSKEIAATVVHIYRYEIRSSYAPKNSFSPVGNFPDSYEFEF